MKYISEASEYFYPLSVPIRIDGVMVSVPVSSAVYRGFKPRSSEPKDYKKKQKQNHRYWLYVYKITSLCKTSHY